MCFGVQFDPAGLRDLVGLRDRRLLALYMSPLLADCVEKSRKPEAQRGRDDPSFGLVDDEVLVPGTGGCNLSRTRSEASSRSNWARTEGQSASAGPLRWSC